MTAGSDVKLVQVGPAMQGRGDMPYINRYDCQRSETAGVINHALDYNAEME